MAISFLFFSVMIPMLEELVKPLAVWLFGNQISTPAQGFALGALCGASFALLETFGVSAQSDDWTTLLLTRLGTDILHVTTAALMGAAIVLRSVSTATCVCWESISCVFPCTGCGTAWRSCSHFPAWLRCISRKTCLNGLGTPLAVALGILAILLLALLILSNRRMRTKPPAPSLEEPVP